MSSKNDTSRLRGSEVKAATRLKLEKGVTLHDSEQPDGCPTTPYSPALAEQMQVAERIMKKRHNALCALAR